MRTALIRLVLSVALFGTILLEAILVKAADDASDGAAQEPASSVSGTLRLTEAERVREIALQVTVDRLTLDEYWSRTFDAIFEFADGNDDGALSPEELGLVPAPRAIRMAMSSGFAPPVGPVLTMSEVAGPDARSISKNELSGYFRRQGIGAITVGYGRLPHTKAMTDVLVRAFDRDRDRRFTADELADAMTKLRPLDANDDELIGVGELIPDATYPGMWATTEFRHDTTLDISRENNGETRLLYQAFAVQPEPNDAPFLRTKWRIEIGDSLRDEPASVGSATWCDNWSIPSDLDARLRKLGEQLSGEPMAKAPGGADSTAGTVGTAGRARGQTTSLAWLTAQADRNRDGKVSAEERQRWLDMQRRLVRGQLLISVYFGGGLFELLDSNHDAGLSVRELKTAWATLQAATGGAGATIEVRRIPDVMLLVASQGYPETLAKPRAAVAEWFERMDRNSDGDVSRREFTGTPAAFQRLDRDQDALISAVEAAASQ